MQVRTVVETSQEVSVEVSLDEVMAEISSLEEPKRVQEALRLLSLCVGVIMKVPDAIIADMNEGQRGTISNALRVQLGRYSNN